MGLVTTVRPTRHCQGCGARLARDNRDTWCAPCQAARRARTLRPPAQPAEFWAVDQMRDALASWHMGRVFRAYRTHPSHRPPVTQQRLAGWLGLTQAQLSRLENGRAPEELSKLIRYAQILAIPQDLLWFKLPGSQPAPPRQVAVQASCGFDSSHEEQVSALLRAVYANTDLPAIDQFRRQLLECQDLDGTSGASQALPRVLTVLGALRRYAVGVKPASRRDILLVAAEAAEFASWLYRDLGVPRSAEYWLDRGMEWAQECGANSMQGYILLKKSQMAYEERDAIRVLTLAQAATAQHWSLPGVVLAEVIAQEARGLAMCGESCGEVERKLDEARRRLESAHRNAEPSPGAYYDENTFLLRSAACYLEAGKPIKAADMFGVVLEGGKLSARDHGYF